MHEEIEVVERNKKNGKFNGELNEELYVNQPTAFTVKWEEGKVN